RIWPDGMIGRSTHTLEQARAAVEEGAAYIGVGPVFAPPTKPGRAAVGVELVAEVRAADLPIPWFAIGGLSAANLPAVLEAGAERVAVVRAAAAANDPAAAARELRAAIEGARITVNGKPRELG